MIRSVAIIGVGVMGSAMARRVHAAGFDLTVCDVNKRALAPFAELGATVTDKPADCAACELIIILVGTPRQVMDVALGENGLASGRLGSRAPIVALMGTVSPKTVHALHDSLAPAGFRVIDAPVSGGLLKAEQGTLTIMTSGDDADIAEAMPALKSMGTQFFQCGARGRAQALKVVNNLVGITSLVLSAEAYRIALAHGLSMEETAPILEASTGRTFYSASAAGAAAAFLASARTYDVFRSMVTLMRKDVELAVDMAADAQGAFPMTRGVKALLDTLGDETYENWTGAGKSHPSQRPS